MAKDAQGTCDGSIGADRPVTDRQRSGCLGFARFGRRHGVITRRRSLGGSRRRGASCAGVSCSGSRPTRRICCSASLRPPATSPWYRAGRHPSPAAMPPASHSAPLPDRAFCRKRRPLFAGKRHFSSPSRITTYLISTAILQPLNTVFLYSIANFLPDSTHARYARKDIRKRFRL